MTPFPRRLAIIGFGEVGQIFTREFSGFGVADIAVYDILFADPSSAPSKAAFAGVRKSPTAHDAVHNADLIVSAVTAASTLDAASSVEDALTRDAYFWDLNSAAPATKRDAAGIVQRAGGRYVEAAVMSSVPPHGIRSPMLLGGPHAHDFARAMAHFDLDLTPDDGDLGTVSAIKMCRSVLIKGFEALLVESMLAARHYGVEGEVLASLGDTIPHPDWQKHAAYMISRALIHGRRRAEEMREVAKTVRDAGVEPLMAAPTAVRDDWAADKGKQMSAAALKPPDLERILDELARLTRDSR